jgi:hypothetical protein
MSFSFLASLNSFFIRSIVEILISFIVGKGTHLLVVCIDILFFVFQVDEVIKVGFFDELRIVSLVDSLGSSFTRISFSSDFGFLEAEGCWTLSEVSFEEISFVAIMNIG